MNKLKEKIKEFRDKQSRTYHNDPDRIIRDYTSVQRSVKDHKDRWLFELIQNCDDETAELVEIRITKKAIYVADNGNGFKPEAVVSISGTDFSNKPAEMIGRKGVGFKSVYQITDNPKVFTGDDQGLEFNQSRAKKWFKDENLEYDENQLPYQWIPFFLFRKDAEEKDSVLCDLKNMSTVVVLPFKSEKERLEAIEKVEEWPSHTLFPFKNIQKLRFHSEETSYEVTVTRKEDIWKLNDTRNESETKWKVLKKHKSTPQDVLKTLEPEDQKYVEEVSFLVAAPFENNIVIPTKDDLPLHVFYPTEEPAPVRLLLHGEFLVKGDRTKLIPLKSSDFNEWVADILTETIMEFVNNSYHSESPSEYLRLLNPTIETKNKTTLALWDNILSQAKEKLLLPNTNGNQELNISQCRVLSVSVRADKAREILSLTPRSQKLLHKSIDEDKDAQKTLSKLGCKKITDEELIDIIKNNISENENNNEWIWNCWEWLGSWLADKPTYSDEYEKRLEQIKSIPLLPISEGLFSISDLKGKEITWAAAENIPQTPDWLPIKFLNDWFQKRISDLHERNPVIRLLNKFDIKIYRKSALVNALKHAIDKYWSNPDNYPGRFLEFLLSDAMKEFDQVRKLSECPVPARVNEKDDQQWVKANQAYLGHEWGHELIEVVFKDVDGIAWALPLKNVSIDEQRELFKSLNCTSYPKINEEKVKNKRLGELPEYCKDWIKNGINRKKFVKKDSIDAIQKLEKINISDLSSDSATALIRLLAENWYNYYWEYSFTKYRWIPRSKEDDKSVDSFWKFQIENKLKPPILNNWANIKPLSKCWLPNKLSQKPEGHFLPIIDIDRFQADKEIVEEWLADDMHLRQDPINISYDEWVEIIVEKIPTLSIDQNLIDNSGFRDIVLKCYEACVKSLDEPPSRYYKNFSDVSLLCRKDSNWDLRSIKDIYLADNPEFSNAFKKECWQIDFSQKNKKRAKSVFGLQMLSEEITETLKPGMEIPAKTTVVASDVSMILPFVYASRCSETQEEPEKIESNLKSLDFKAVDGLKALLELGDVTSKEITKDYGISGSRVFINTSISRQVTSTIALALADAVGVKSEADFYENLLRCKTDDARLGKLSTKGLTEEVIERYIRDFKDDKPPTEIEFSTTHSNKKSGNGKTQNKKSRAPQQNKSESEKTRSHGSKSSKTNNREKSADHVKPELSVKNINTAAITFASDQPGESSQTSSKTSRQSNSSGSSQLSQSDKYKIEKSGRNAAERKLKEKGYHVEQMPQDNPGFDIKAKKDGKELRIEIKAHRSLSSNIEISQRQILEYEQIKNKVNVNWELWNVEKLSENSPGPIKITRYSSLPEETWSMRAVTINLKECEPVRDELK